MNRYPAILLLFFAVFSYGQVTLVAALEDKDYKVNQKVTLTFVLKLEGNEFVQESPLRLPDFSKFNVVGNASDQNSFVDPAKKIIINQMVYQWVLTPKQAGKVRIGSILVDVSGRTYKTEPIDIVVKDADKKAADNAVAKNSDAYLDLQLESRTIYENQPTKAILRLYSNDIDNFRKVEAINLPSGDNLEVRPISYSKSEIEPSEKRPNWASQIIAVYMVLPNEAGNISLPNATVVLKDAGGVSRIQSNKVKINVKDFPKGAPIGFKNGVGKNYRISIEKDSPDADAEVGKPLHITVKMSGQGDLDPAAMPKLKKSGAYTFYETTTPKNAEETQGLVVQHYIVVPKTAGTVTLATEPLAFFEPDQHKYLVANQQALPITVMTAEQIADATTTLEKVNGYTNSLLQTVNSNVATKKGVVKKEESIGLKPILCSILFLGFALAVFFRLRKKPKDPVVRQPSLSIREIEESLRDREFFDADSHLKLLRDKVQQRDFDGFFANYSDFISDAETYSQRMGNKNLSDFLEAHAGLATAEDFRILQQKIQMEKYAPSHSEVAMLDILAETKRVFGPLQNY